MDRALVVCASQFSSDYIKKISKNYDFIVAVDRGAEAFSSIDIKPNLMVGDFDSINTSILRQFENIEKLEYNSDKDFSDLELAVLFLKTKDVKTIDFSGVLGGRISHELFNLGVIMKLKEEGYKVSIREKDKRLIYMKDGEILRLPAGLRVSIVPLYNEGSIISLRGFKWDLTNKKILRGSSLTLSNETIKDAYIKLKGKTIIVVCESIKG